LARQFGGVPAGKAKTGPGVKWADGGLAGPSFPRNVAFTRWSDQGPGRFLEGRAGCRRGTERVQCVFTGRASPSVPACLVVCLPAAYIRTYIHPKAQRGAKGPEYRKTSLFEKTKSGHREASGGRLTDVTSSAVHTSAGEAHLVAKDPMARVLLSRWAGEEPQQLYHILDCMASRLFHLCRDIFGLCDQGRVRAS
jgi:hypothetical protein